MSQTHAQCYSCEFIAEGSKSLENHLRSEKHGFKCNYCDAIENSETVLSEHVSVSHTEMECPICGEKSNIFDQ